jgi:outer membrane protein assembly factor BamE (lipoprotein component of BamABCDE complex)
MKAESNRDNILKLEVGMTKSEVLTIMGKPFTSEAYEENNQTVIAWYYMTLNCTYHPSCFTGVYFENGKVKMWGVAQKGIMWK